MDVQLGFLISRNLSSCINSSLLSRKDFGSPGCARLANSPTVAREGQTFWSDSATPSTHILKPEGDNHSGLELIESAALKLANAAGVHAPDASQMKFGPESVFAIERFDRIVNPATGRVSRLHVEDMTQALGRPVSDKEAVYIDDIVELLREHSGDDELGYEFIRQLAFNVIIGNTDAHGKNYSVFLDLGQQGTNCV